MPDGVLPNPEQQRALAIFRYLRDLARLRLVDTRDLDNYQRVFWLEAVRGKPGCVARCFRPCGEAKQRDGESADPEVWLTVRKLPEPIAPAPPVEIRDWIAPESGRSPDSPPRLLDRIPREPVTDHRSRPARRTSGVVNGHASALFSGGTCTPTAGEYELLEDHPDIAIALNEYVTGSWELWAERHAAWADFQDNVYAPLFAIHRDLKRLGEEFELVLGLGCLTWKTPTGQQVKRHLIAAQVTLEFDPAGGTFRLRPGSDGAKLALEVDVLEPAEQPTVAQMEVLKADLAEADDDPWDFEAIDRVLRGFAHAVQDDGTYDPAAYAARAAGRVPFVAFAPALLLRRRTSRGVLLAFEEVIRQLEHGESLPPGVRRLTGEAPGDDRPSPAAGSPADGRVYFPLPANDDQRQIVAQLNDRHGVLVQGPPGTGKSHTIANLICHLLASGQRVLITAQTPRALQVLRDKLPAEIRPLCLSVLGNDKVAQDNVENSVRTITDKADNWNPAVAVAEVRQLESDLDRLMARETALEREVRTFREAEVHEHTVADGAYRGTAQAIAQLVRRDRPRFAWFTDHVLANAQPPFDAGELNAYLDGLTRIGPGRAAELRRRRPERGNDIPADDTLVRLVQAHRDRAKRVKPVGAGEDRLGTVPWDELQAARSALRSLQAAAQHLPLAATPWAAVALNDVLRGAGVAWDMLLAQTTAAVDAQSGVAANLDTVDIRLPAGRRSDVLLADVTDLLDHLQRGGRLGFWLFRANVVRRTRYLWHEATVGGRPCDTIAALTKVKEYLECSAVVARAWTHWEGKASPTTRTNNLQVGELRELAAILGRVLAVRPLADAAASALSRLNLPTVPPLHDLRAIDEFAAGCERAIVRRELEALNSQLEARSQALQNLAAATDAHPVCGRLAEALRQRDSRGVAAALNDLAALDADAARLAETVRLGERISAAVPELARAIAESPADGAWKARFAEWRAAWRWAQAGAWLNKYTDAGQAAVAEAELRQVKQRIADCLARASAERAWQSCLTSMSAAHRQYLNAWRQAVRKIGRTGRGKHAGHWRRVAQSALEKCRDAIPAWVMPLYRVFETVKPAPGIFDVVIVDEASQCGPESLILFYLAKKMIVVGDDKQISPSNVGIDRDQAKVLLRQHLAGMELADTFDVDSSLFDHGQIRLGKRIMLREHFRCVPEIIRFSNDLCYNGALIPLRQYPPHRLAPFVPRHIPHGKREGGPASATNAAEAEAIAQMIAACCADPMYDGKTMGVISLLGEHQAKLIERLLLQQIGAEEIERRRIVCGDAYSFQGDERHVIFLSMVVSVKGDGARGFTALTGNQYQQRFNVAASRAQDQLWLFHSVMPEDVGNHECMRHKLLTYFYDPARHAAQSVGVDLAELRRQAADEHRPELPPSPFDSWFEVDVYLRIAARGYRVLPQYRAGRHRIDLVVEGATRLAVECDGDRWHGPDKFDEDMARQRQLERAGWRFWRVRGGVFYHDPDAALRPLWTLLSELGIEPLPATDGSGSSDGYVPHVPRCETISEPTAA